MLFRGPSYAQAGIAATDELTKLKGRTLVVVVEEPDAKLLSKLTPDQQNQYKSEIDEYNTLIKWGIETYYAVGNPVEFKLRSEAFPLMKKGDANYAFLEYSKFTENYFSKAGFELVQKNRQAKEQTKFSGALSLGSLVSRLDLRLAEQYPTLLASRTIPPFYGHYMPNPFPQKAEMAAALKQLGAIIAQRATGAGYDQDEKIMRQDSKKLADLTLLVWQDELDGNEDRSAIAKYYPFPMEVVTKEVLDNAIISGDSRYAVVRTIPFMQERDEEESVQFQFRVVDCAAGKTLAVSKPQDKFGVSAENQTISALKGLKKSGDSKIPRLRKENFSDFSLHVK